MRLTLLISLLFLSFFTASGQSSGDFRSVSSGDWNNVAIWQTFNGTTWVAASSTPDNLSNNIDIQALHEVTVPTGVTIPADQVRISGSLIIASGATFDLKNGAAADLDFVLPTASVTVNGTLIRRDQSTIANNLSALNFTFAAGSSYYHNYGPVLGDLPIATWNASSTVLITTLNNTTDIEANASWQQQLGNVTYSCPNQRGSVNFDGHLTDINGNLNINTTRGYLLQLSGEDDFNLEVAGDLSFSGNSRVLISSGGVATVNIGGNFTYNSTNSAGTYLTTNGTTTVNVSGDFSMNATIYGKLRFAGSGTTGSGIMNLYGDFALVSGRIDELGSEPSSGTLRFLKNGVQNFLNSGNITGHIDYYVSAGSTLDLGQSPVTGSAPSSFTLDGTVVLGSLDQAGALSASTTSGNIRTPNRLFNPGSVISYQGTGAQVLGNGHPTTSGVTTIINNAQGVSLASDITFAGVLELAGGSLDLNDFRLTLQGAVQYSGGTFAGTDNSQLTISGTGDGNWGSLMFAAGADSLATLTINRAGNAAAVEVGGNLVVTSALNLINGTLFNNGTLNMANAATVYRYEGGSVTGNALQSVGNYNVVYTSTSASGGPYATITTGMELPTGSGLGDFSVSFAQHSDQLVMGSHIIVNGTVNLVRGGLAQGAFDITMRGSDWNDNGGTFISGSGSVIFDGNNTNVNGTSITFGNIELRTTKALVFLNDFVIEGNVLFDAGSTFSMGSYTATLSGNNPQTISANGASFSNITVSKGNSQGVTLTSSLELTGVLQFRTPSVNVNFQSNGFLVLRSTSDQAGSGTASIYRLLAGNQVSGSVTVERSIAVEKNTYRYISSPVTNATVAQLKDNFLVQGNFVDPSPTQRICGVIASSSTSSLFYYEETAAGSGGYTAYPLPGTTTAASPLAVGRGYSAYIRQCINPTLIDFQGVVNQGAVSLPVSYTVSDPANDGWNLVGNPYPCTIDWDNAGWTKARMSTAFSITDNATGMTRVYDPGVSDDVPNGQIASGQAFWVRATSSNPVLAMNENVKVEAPAEFFRERSSIPSFALALSDGENTDRAYAKKLLNASPAFDTLDIPKILNPNFSLSILSTDLKPLAVTALDNIDCNAAFELRMDGLVQGEYKLALDSRSFFPALDFVLVDRFTGKRASVKDREYAFAVTEEARSSAANRFSLQIVTAVTAFAGSVAFDAEVCAESEASLLLNDSEKGLTYSVWVNDEKMISTEVAGTGKAVELTVPADSLENGVNTVSIRAVGSCVIKELPELHLTKAPLVKPEITFTGESLLSNYMVGNQWFFNGQPLEGAVGQEYFGAEPGLYELVVTKGGCTSSTSFTLEKGSLVDFYPNPASEFVILNNIDESVDQIDLTDVLGASIKNVYRKGENFDRKIGLTSIPDGLYLLIVTKGQKRVPYRIIKNTK